MRRKRVYGVAAGIILAVLFLSGVVFWVLGTSAGARWLMGRVSSHTSVGIDAKKVEGRIWGDLRLADVTARWPDGGLRADSIRVSWDPLRLLYGKVDVGVVMLSKVYLQDDRPETSEIPEIEWPHLAGLLSRISVNVGVFSIRGLTYRRLKKNPIGLDDISCGIRLKKGVLTVQGLRARSPMGKTEGTLRTGLVKPSLYLDLAVFPAKPAGGMDMISVNVQMRARNVSGPLKGDVRIAGSSDMVPRIELRSGLELRRHVVRFDGLRVTRIIVGGSITGSGEIAFTEKGPRVHLSVNASGLDLSPFLHSKTDLSVRVAVEGTAKDYHGRLDLSNKGDSLRTVRLSGLLRGDNEGMKMDSIEGSWLGGTVRGMVHTRWKENISLLASIELRDINPSLISPEWSGRINADARGSALLSGNKPLSASFSARLLKSSLRGKVLTGEVKAGLAGSNLLVHRILLQGKGFNVTAHGELRKRIFFAADISDLSGLVPDTRGMVHTAGWVGWHDGFLSADVDGRGGRIQAGGLHIGAADFSARLGEGEGHPLRVRTSVKSLVFDRVKIDSASLSADGTLADHVMKLGVRSPVATINAKLSGGYEKGEWSGEILEFSDKDASGVLRLYSPSTLLVSRRKFSLSKLVMKGAPGESFEAGGELAFGPLEGSMEAQWAGIDLDRANYWLDDLKVAGRSSGKIYARWLRNVLFQLSAQAEASGTFVAEGQKMRVNHASVQIDRGEHRLLASFDVGMDKGTVVKGHFSSSIESGNSLPEEGTIDADLHNLDLSLFRKWVPEGLEIGGEVSGSLKGRLLAHMRLDVAGDAAITGGVISRRSEKGEVSASLRTAEVRFAWHDRSLTGDASLVLQNHGHASGSFKIPLTAVIPPSMEGNGPVDVSLNGQFQEEGLLAALFPGLMQETHGLIDLNVKVGGTWKAPDFKGEVRLSKAGAYFLAGGIRIKDAGMTAHLEGDKVTVDSFQASSGKGKIEGNAEIRLNDRTVASYKGTLKGKDFQVMYLPELRVEASPDLSFEGSQEKLSVKGEVRIPFLLVLQSKTKTPVEPSEDVIIIDRKAKPEKAMKTAVDIQVKIILGDRVLVKAEGIDARMEGSVDLTARSAHDITGKGEIRVVKGKYSAYGVNLDIERGRVVFTGQSISKPSLDVLALRKTDDVKAGVTVTGTPENPVVKLYSDPAMSDTDILSYIVLGHPLGEGQQESDLVARAAGLLLSASDSVVFQDQLKQRIGIDTLDIESAPASRETGQETDRQGVARSLVTVGKYLTPKLYISYGRSLVGDTDLFRVRYSLSKHWELETQSGTESGADLFYKIDLK